MRKILSIIIPTFNMEALLPRCLDSLIIMDDNISKLEVWVVNDGSNDKSSEIAHLYESKYPGIINVIDKSNGHYGSCINAALQKVTGKYVRILDSDDWFETTALNEFLLVLERIDVDCVYTQYTKCFVEENRKEIEVCDELDYNSILEVSKRTVPESCMVMHSLTFKTSLLKSINYRQTEGICYTDTEYVYYPLFNAKTFYATRINLYNYMIGREGQTMSMHVIKKQFSHFYKIYDRLIASYSKIGCSDWQVHLTESFVVKMIKYMSVIFLILNYNDSDIRSKYDSLILNIKNNYPEIYNNILHIKVFGFPFVRLYCSDNFCYRFLGRLFSVAYNIKTNL